MVSVSAQDFINVMHISDTPTQMEYVLDMAIRSLILCGVTGISTMSGDAGSKTVTLTDAQMAGVFEAARAIYYDYWKPAGTGGGSGSSESWNVGGMSESSSSSSSTSLMGNANVRGVIEKIAAKLKSPPIYVKNDPLPNE